jgi:hypothetical protein
MADRQTAAVHALNPQQEIAPHSIETVATGTAPKSKGRFAEVLDWLVKLLPIFATIAVAVIADHYKVALTTSTLLSEREKADSQLRTEMFSKLVDPISGGKGGTEVTVERERLLAELLALNFHEHIELKPLLLYVDRKLAGANAEDKSQETKELKRSRQSLRAVARLVSARQTAQLTKVNGDENAEASTHVLRLDVGPPIPPAQVSELPGASDVIVKKFAEPFEIPHPSGKYKLWLTMGKPDLQNETLPVDASIYATGKNQEKEQAHHAFELSWFDFPLTDNTLLADGTRFAIVLEQIYDLNERLAKDAQGEPVWRVKIKIIWFPRDYISARERPTNHREFRRNLGISD